MMTTELTRGQIAAIKREIRAGAVLASESPEIADRYRGGFSLRDIAEEDRVMQRFGFNSVEAARNAIRFALIGYEGRYKDIPPYHGLLSRTERRELEKKHKVLAGNATSAIYGEEAYEKGLKNLTVDKLKEQGRKTGNVWGRRAQEEGLGVFRSLEELSSKGGTNSARARGFVPYDNKDEVAYLLAKSEDPEYQTPTGIAMTRIAREVNERFHDGRPVRNRNGLKTFLARRLYAKINL